MCNLAPVTVWRCVLWLLEPVYFRLTCIGHMLAMARAHHCHYPISFLFWGSVLVTDVSLVLTVQRQELRSRVSWLHLELPGLELELVPGPVPSSPTISSEAGHLALK